MASTFAGTPEVHAEHAAGNPHELMADVAALKAKVSALERGGQPSQQTSTAAQSEMAALRAEVKSLRAGLAARDSGAAELPVSSLASSSSAPAAGVPSSSAAAAADSASAAAAADSSSAASAAAAAEAASGSSSAPTCSVPSVTEPVGGAFREPYPEPRAIAGRGRKVGNKRGECSTIWEMYPMAKTPAERWPSNPELAACEELWRYPKVHYQCPGQPGSAAPRSDWSLVRCCPPLPYDVDPEARAFPAAARSLTTEQSWADVQKYGYPRRALLSMLEPLCFEPSMRGWSEQDEVKMGNCAQGAGTAHLMERVDMAKLSSRVVYVDLGSRDYAGVGKKLGRMPHAEAFTEQVLFELDAKFYDGYKNLPPNVKFYKGGAFVRDGYLEFRAISMASLDENAPLKPLDANGPPAGHVRVYDLARVLMEELSLTPKDFVVVKMDIECTEYIMLKHLVDTGAADLIDEVFVETHWGPACKGASKSRGDAEDMYRYARDGGLYVHDDGQPYLWPGVPYDSGNVVHM